MDEDSRYNQIMTDVWTYVEETFMKFVMGREPLGNWDAYVAKVNSMGLAEAQKIRQASLDRYNKR
jgi:putative aldouronate transport system substrate-binding protein